LISFKMTVTEKDRGRLILMKENGKRDTSVARALGIDKSTVGRIWKHYQQAGSTSAKTSTGRPSILTERGKRYAARLMHSGDSGLATKTAQVLQKNEQVVISAEGIRRVMRARGEHGRKKALKPLLTAEQKQARLTFALKYANKPLDYWQKVIFSDEAIFQIHPHKRGTWTWRKPGERFSERNLSTTLKFGGGHIMVWSCLTMHGIGFSCLLKEGEDGETYVAIIKDELQKTAKLYFWGDQRGGFST